MQPMQPIREQLARALDWEEAHVGFSKAVAGIPPDHRGARANGFAHTPWQMLEHLRLALHDLAEFALNAQYDHAMRWPDDYWPPNAAPSASEWDASVAAFRADLARLQSLARNPVVDLIAPVPTGNATQTYLRTLLLVIDHNAYHVGQLVALRQALGIWR